MTLWNRFACRLNGVGYDKTERGRWREGGLNTGQLWDVSFMFAVSQHDHKTRLKAKGKP